MLFAGCHKESASEIETESAVPPFLPTAPSLPVIETSAPTEEPTTAPTEPAPQIVELSQSYTVNIPRDDFPIYGTPGYDAPPVGVVEQAGIYTIVTECRYPDGSLWGKLKSGAGWVDLDLIHKESEEKNHSNCPYILTLRDDFNYLYERASFESACVQRVFAGAYTIVEEQYDAYGNLWGKFKSGAGWICLQSVGFSGEYGEFYGYCLKCGRAIGEWNFVVEGFGLCSICHYESLDPEEICDNCGADCSLSGTTNGLCPTCFEKKYHTDGTYCAKCHRCYIPLNDYGLCDSCAAGECFLCGGHLGTNHDCDDYPNVVCSHCGWGMFTTGVGTDGISCRQCGAWVIEPSYYVDESVAGYQWKMAYLKYIFDLENAGGRYTYNLVNVDADGIPELFVHGGCEADGSMICAYKNGQVVEQHLRRLGGASYIPGSGLVRNCNGNMGNYSTDIYRLGSNGFIELFHGLQEDSYEEIVNEFGEYEYITISRFYISNGSEVTEEAFLAAQSEIFDFGAAEAFGYEGSSSNKIERQIRNW
jgi:hypothetical protein